MTPTIGAPQVPQLWEIFKTLSPEQDGECLGLLDGVLDYYEDQLLTADEVSKRLISNIKLLLDTVGASEPRPCKGCGRPVRWIETKNGRRAPITEEGLSHFVDCPDAVSFRKGGN